jgi:competence protein ComEC
VGQGDSIALRFPDGRTWVLDGGGLREPPPPIGPRFDVGEAVVSRYLWSEGLRRLDRVLLSHPHHDHAGGLPALMRNFAPLELEHTGPEADATLARLIETARGAGAAPRRLAAGAAWSVGGVGVEVLNPPAAGPARSINDGSMVVGLAFGRFSALLTGDLESEGERGLVASGAPLDAFLLKVAHHGSRSATLGPFLERVRPRWAVVSAGRNNPFGHPAREVLLRLARCGARPLTTIDQGAITLGTDGRSYSVETFVSGMIESGELPPTRK